MTETRTATDPATYEELRSRHVARFGELLPPMIEKLYWPADALARHRTTELRRLLHSAREASPWHRERLAGLDLDTIDESDLSALPVMTKNDLMENFDGIVTDPRLRLRVVEDHLDAMTGDGYLFDRYHAAASGGSTGTRGVFVFDWDAWATMFGSLQRHNIAAMQAAPSPTAMRIGFVMAAAPVHISRTVVQTFSTGQADFKRLPVTLPVDEIVDGLNDYGPNVLMGYPSALHQLAAEVRSGRLRIAPRSLHTTAEVLLPETRAALEDAFGVTVGNNYALSEGGAAAPACRAGAMHLSEDLLVIEPVDSDGHPVPAGRRCDELYLTNLYNHALPLIRYEVTDQIELLTDTAPCPCGSTHRRIADPYGRLDDVFRYGADARSAGAPLGELTVHPHVFRSPLSRRREIVEYQVRQTADGADIAVRATDRCATDDLAADIAAELTRVGLTSPRVRVRVVDRLERPASGKLIRFVSTERAALGAV